MFREHSKTDLTKTIVQKVSKLPLFLFIGGLIGGGAYFYTSKKSEAKKVKVITGLGKIIAPYVIITLLDKFGEFYDKKQVKKKLREADSDAGDLLLFEVM